MQPPRPVILVIEDSAMTRRMLQLLLEPAGYTVELAADGETGLARIEAGGVDLVLLDLVLPGLDGAELCRRVRALESEVGPRPYGAAVGACGVGPRSAAVGAGGVYLPIIMLTALGGDTLRLAGFAEGADDYLTKPFNSAELLARVQVWVRTRQRLQAHHDARKRLEVERERAELEGVLRAVRTIEQELNAQLSRTAGQAALLARSSALPSQLQEAAAETLRGAQEAVRVLNQFHQVASILETSWDAEAAAAIALARQTD
jgi:DNA-binding response OmpR family regulator